MELFNEVITLFTLYLMMCFSDFVVDPETRSFCGFGFIGVISLYAAVHIMFLLTGVYMQIRHLVRSKYYARRNKKILARRKQQQATPMTDAQRLQKLDKDEVEVKLKNEPTEREMLENIPEVSDHRLEISDD